MKRIMLAMVLVLFLSVNANALSWDWSFNEERGYFETDSESALIGWHDVVNFVVVSSGRGATIGSWSTGEYAARGYWTIEPYRFQRDGQAVTQWDCQGMNVFDWLVFKDLATVTNFHFYFFGWQTGPINTVLSAVYYADLGRRNQPSYALHVAPELAVVTSASPGPESVPVPEPATMFLLALGVAGILTVRKRA